MANVRSAETVAVGRDSSAWRKKAADAGDVCRGEFLVGGGMESVETIVRLKAEVRWMSEANSLDESCR